MAKIKVPKEILNYTNCISEDQYIELYERIKLGLTVKDACGHADFDVSMFYKKRATNSHFARFVNKAKKAGTLERLKHLNQQSKDGNAKASMFLLSLNDRDYSESAIKDPYNEPYKKCEDTLKKMAILMDALADGAIGHKAFNSMVNAMEKKENISKLDDIAKKNKELEEKLDSLLSEKGK